MVDTYFSDKYIELTDENFDKFKLIFDFNDVCEENYPEKYDDCDLYRYVRVDSGGRSLSRTYRKKQAKRSKEKMRNILMSEIASLETQLSWKKRELIDLENGIHYKLK